MIGKRKIFISGFSLTLAVVMVLFLSTPSAFSAGNAIGVTKKSGGDVMVDLTPEKLVDGKLYFSVKVNTHSVNDLDKYDLAKIILLEFENQEIRPVSVPRLGGHHAGGDLVFKLSEIPEKFTITISGLHDKEPKVFTWD